MSKVTKIGEEWDCKDGNRYVVVGKMTTYNPETKERVVLVDMERVSGRKISTQVLIDQRELFRD